MMELESYEGDFELRRCHICALTFPTQEVLSDHLHDSHGGKELLLARSDVDAKANNVTANRPKGPIQNRKEGVLVSEMETQRGDDEIGRCHVCGDVFPTQEELSRHLMKAHPDQGLDPSTQS